MKLIFATGNAHKLAEVQRILGDDFSLVSLSECGITEDIPETQPTIEGNALQKARFVHAATGADCFADDTGLEVDALGGAPGVHSARYATDGHDFAANTRLLLTNLKGHTRRSARFRTVIALILDGREYLFEGVVNGDILEAPTGDGGFRLRPRISTRGFSRFFRSDVARTEKCRLAPRTCRAKLEQFLKNHKKV